MKPLPLLLRDVSEGLERCPWAGKIGSLMGRCGDARTPAAAGESRATYRERVLRGSMVEVERVAQQRPESCMETRDDQQQTLDETERESWNHASFM